MAYQTVDLNIKEHVATITLNRPETLNAMNEDMIHEITHAAKAVGKDKEVHVVVFTGAGKGFSSGGDLSMDVYSTTDSGDLYRFMDTVSDMAKSVSGIPQPTIASVNGAAVGGGCNLALACDMILASEKARFSQIFVKGNLHPDTGGSFFLPRLVGIPKAMELMLTGRMLAAQEAMEIGLLTQVVPADQLEEAVTELAGAIAKASPVVTRMIKASLYAGLKVDLPEALDNEARAQIMIMTSGIFKKP